MIEIIPTLLTPAMLALSPPACQAPTVQYDWQSQTAQIIPSGEAQEPAQTASLKGTQSYVGKNLMIDDWNQD